MKNDKFDLVGFMMDWENRDIPQKELVEGFQHIVDSGMWHSLQGMYGREAHRLIRAGLVKDTHHEFGE